MDKFDRTFMEWFIMWNKSTSGICFCENLGQTLNTIKSLPRYCILCKVHTQTQYSYAIVFLLCPLLGLAFRCATIVKIFPFGLLLPQLIQFIYLKTLSRMEIKPFITSLYQLKSACVYAMFQRFMLCLKLTSSSDFRRNRLIS